MSKYAPYLHHPTLTRSVLLSKAVPSIHQEIYHLQHTMWHVELAMNSPGLPVRRASNLLNSALMT
jgi:hypothetical protein